LLHIEKKLEKFYDKYATNEGKAIYSFFASEIQGNLKLANKVNIQHKISEYSDIINRRNSIIDIFTD
jgi:hypothetical protein